MMKMLFLGLLCICICPMVFGDMYLHNPMGNNDRNRERNGNRNNGDRIFDSQNNGAGGYPWNGDPTHTIRPTRDFYGLKDGGEKDFYGLPDEVSYYVGSKIQLEWANQHACGPQKNVRCEVVIQYGCEDSMKGLRDGYPTAQTFTDIGGNGPNNNDGAQQMYYKRDFTYNNQDGTATIPESLGIAGQSQGLVAEGEFEDACESDRCKAFYDGNMDSDGTGKMGTEYGKHENWNDYYTCKHTERNRGLYWADQTTNGNDARFTRQNENGQRRGLECGEERDYYPYWRPTPWKDIAVLPAKTKHCSMYQKESQNVSPKYYCECDQECRQNANLQGQKIPIEESKCRSAQGKWREVPAWNIPIPACIPHAQGADNHLGMAFHVNQKGKRKLSKGQPQYAGYTFTFTPDMAGAKASLRDEGQLCVFRLRYNISTGDYPGHRYVHKSKEVYDHSYNCPDGQKTGGEDLADNPQCYDTLLDDNIPLYERPYVKVFKDMPKLSIAINTDQSSRTFQDRTFVFRVKNRPREMGKDDKIWNLSMRGTRGNIVQTYPSTEYQFTPTHLTIDHNTWISYNCHGSDFNEERNANNGEGWEYSGRCSLLQTRHASLNIPRPEEKINIVSDKIARRLAMPHFEPPHIDTGTKPEYSTYSLVNCLEKEDYDAGNFDGANFNEAIVNCGKLNHMPRMYNVNFKVSDSSDGEYSFVDTRNNNFSNRSQKFTLYVEDKLSGGAIAGISVAVVAVVAGASAFGIYRWKKRGGGLGENASV